jgi:hypothetical protein
VSPTSEVKEVFSDIPFHKNSISFWISFLWYISALYMCSVCPLRTFLQLCMEDSEGRFCRLLCHQSRQSNVPSTGKRNVKGICDVEVVKRPHLENENTWILQMKVVVALLALYFKCSIFCFKTVKPPIVRLVAVFLSTDEKQTRIRMSILPQHPQRNTQHWSTGK